MDSRTRSARPIVARAEILKKLFVWYYIWCSWRVPWGAVRPSYWSRMARQPSYPKANLCCWFGHIQCKQILNTYRKPSAILMCLSSCSTTIHDIYLSHTRNVILASEYTTLWGCLFRFVRPTCQCEGARLQPPIRKYSFCTPSQHRAMCRHVFHGGHYACPTRARWNSRRTSLKNCVISCCIEWVCCRDRCWRAWPCESQTGTLMPGHVCWHCAFGGAGRQSANGQERNGNGAGEPLAGYAWGDADSNCEHY